MEINLWILHYDDDNMLYALAELVLYVRKNMKIIENIAEIL